MLPYRYFVRTAENNLVIEDYFKPEEANTNHIRAVKIYVKMEDEVSEESFDYSRSYYVEYGKPLVIHLPKSLGEIGKICFLCIKSFILCKYNQSIYM